MKIHHIAITVNDLEESIKFYTEHFGFTVVKEFKRPDLGGEAALIEQENMQLELWQFEDVKTVSPEILSDLKCQGIRHIAFDVRSVDAVRGKLIGKGVRVSKVEKGASGSNYCFLNDPSGVVLELYETHE